MLLAQSIAETPEVLKTLLLRFLLGAFYFKASICTRLCIWSLANISAVTLRHNVKHVLGEITQIRTKRPSRGDGMKRHEQHDAAQERRHTNAAKMFHIITPQYLL